MLFNSLAFLAFFPIVCLVYFIIPSLRWRNLFLLAASYFFYMNWEPVYALLLLSSTLITYFTSLIISRLDSGGGGKIVLAVSILLNISILFFFKYYNFIADNLTTILHYLGLSFKFPKFSILLPVGISFYIFQALGYSIDVYRRKTPIERDFFTYALFVSFFPQLVAGPIERSTNLLPQFKIKKKFEYESFMSGFRLMLWGYFLKLCLADRCGHYVDAVFNNVQMHNGGSFLIASILFPFQIYGDFAGYSLIAIGVSKVLGFQLLENFRRPYFATSITDFWRRWHISLSTWFKDYIYIPLGGNRVGKIRCYRNVMVTFIVSGIWHGANWTFLIWGTIHGVLQCIEKWLGLNKKVWKGKKRVLHTLITFGLVCLTWVFFRANNVSDALYIIKGIFSDFGRPFLALAEFGAIMMALFIVFFKEAKDEFGWNISLLKSSNWVVSHTIIVLLISYIILFGVLNGGQFIYFQF